MDFNDNDEYVTIIIPSIDKCKCCGYEDEHNMWDENTPYYMCIVCETYFGEKSYEFGSTFEHYTSHNNIAKNVLTKRFNDEIQYYCPYSYDIIMMIAPYVGMNCTPIVAIQTLLAFMEVVQNVVSPYEIIKLLKNNKLITYKYIHDFLVKMNNLDVWNQTIPISFGPVCNIRQEHDCDNDFKTATSSLCDCGLETYLVCDVYNYYSNRPTIWFDDYNSNEISKYIYNLIRINNDIEQNKIRQWFIDNSPRKNTVY